jgi:general secretion pathway protein A
MYNSHFGLRQRPFPATPDPARYYPATSHERALARLLHGLADGEGLLVLTGPPGSGKTLLCHCLLERLGSEVATAFLTNSHVTDRAGLFQAILYDLSLSYEGRSEQEMRLILTDHLLKSFAAGKRTVLLIDEAQHLTVDLLEELRLLGNLEARTGKAVQVVLVGQPSLLETLRAPELTGLRQRLAVRAELQPLALQEAADYLLHHVRVAGGKPERVFADEALEIIAQQGKGVPRLLNQAAHQALLLASDAGAAEVDAEVALEALDMLGLWDESVGTGRETPASEVFVAVQEPQDEPKLVSPESAAPADESAGPSEEDETACRLFLAPARAE